MTNEIIKFPQTIKELEKFIDCYQDKLVHHAFFKLGDKEEAEDVVQEVIVKVFRERKKYKDLANPIGYVFRMVSNACIDKLRVKKNMELKKENYLKETPDRFSEDSSIKLLEKEEYERINAILSKIPPDQAEIIQQRVIDEMSFVEISKVLEIPITTVKSRFKYGIGKLKSLFQNLKEVPNEL